MIRVNTCCCGCSLRTGSLILLWLMLIGGVYATITSAAVMTLSHIFDTIDPPFKTFFKMNLFIKIVFAIAAVITAIFGINGIMKNKAKYLTPYLYYIGSELVHIVLFILVAILALQGIKLDTETRTTIKAEILVSIFALPLQTYFYIVIRSYRETILEEAAGNHA